MPCADNQGVRIYYEVEGEGPPLVLHHGLGASSVYWRITGYVEPLSNDYRLILMDARGHGRSDKPHAPEAYKWPVRVADVKAVLDDLGIDRAHYLGYSMGGAQGWCIARHAPHRFYSLIIGAASPRNHGPDQHRARLELYERGMETSLAAAEQMLGRRWTAEVRAMAAANDLEALIALLRGEGQKDVEEILPTIATPVLLYAGVEDAPHAAMKEAAKILPNASFVSVPGDHLEAEYQSDRLVPHIRKFLAKVGEG